MIVYILKRLAFLVVLLLAMSLLTFAATQILPGNVAYIILGQFATPEQIAELELKLGLNDPFVWQYWRWLSAALSGDFGNSLVQSRPIAPLILGALQRSAALAAISFVLIATLGIILGVTAAVYRNSFIDHVISFATYVLIGIPGFLWAILLILVFSVGLRWLPSTGYAPIEDGFASWARHLILPVAALVLSYTAHICRLTRSSTLEQLNSPYVMTARAKGLPERIVIWRHAVRNSLLPTITVLAVDVGSLLGGVIVVEVVFSFSGLGRLIIYAVEQKDIPIIQAGILTMTAVYALSNLAADILYAAVNPRIRYGSASTS